MKNSSQFVQLTDFDYARIFAVVSHARFVEHFLVKILGVGVDFIVLCFVLLNRNLVDFRFRIVVVVDWLECGAPVEVIDVSS